MDCSSWGAVFVLQLLVRVSADQAVLEDQPMLIQSGIWEWNWKTLKPDTAQDGGWTKLTTGQNSKPRYVTCSTGLLLTQQPNNWLRSKLLLGVSKINRIDITLEYAITQPCRRSFCTETIDLYVNQSDTYKPADKYPNPFTNAEAYKKFGSVSRQSGGIQMETVSLPVNTEYILLAFRDEGGCKVLYSVKVTYNFCAKQTLNNSLVSLPKTVAPENDLKPLRVNGSCTEETVPLLSGSVSIQCQSNGNWNESGFEGRCVCKEGTENTGGKCQDCPYGKYNMHKGGNCSLCPANSESTNDRKSCTCKKTFYRAPDESITENCTGLPSEPRHAIVVFFNQSTVVLEWFPPEHNGGRSDVYYEVECKRCDEDDGRACVNKACADEVDYIPDKKRFNGTSVTVTNLFSFVNYTFVIYAKNGISAVASSEDTKFTSLSVRTNGYAPGVLRVEVVKISENAIRVSWTLDRKNGIVKAYYVSYAVVGDSENVETIKTMETSVVITGLKPGKTYEFVVMAENHVGLSPSSKATFALGPPVSSDTAVLVAIIAVVSTLLVIAVAMIVLFVLCRRRNTPIRTQPRHQHPSGVSHPGGSVSRAYDNVFFLDDQASDTRTQNDALYMVVDDGNSFELKRNEIKIQKLLGSGSFGKVFKASMGNKVVAVKSLKENATAKDKQDMLTELELMKRLLPHPHVVMLIGCCSCDDPLLIVLDYLPYGDLLGYLRKSRGHTDNYNTGEMTPTSKLTSKDLLSFAWMIADGMNYLAKMKVVHRDLAARNVLVGENKICKISDFGLARGVEADIYVRGTQARLPVKWMPPESLFLGESSIKSDVWSYGILLWEVFTIGDSPYPGIKANQVASLLETGYRMPRPIHISQDIFSIMSECWSEIPDNRPTFQWISTAIRRLQNDEKVYINLDVYKDKDYVNFDMFDSH